MDHLKHSKLQTLTVVVHLSFLTAAEILPPREQDTILPARLTPVSPATNGTIPSAEVLFLQIAG